MSIKPIRQNLKQSLSKSRAEAIDNILSYLFLSENRDEWDWIMPFCDERLVAKAITAFNRIPLTHFDGADASWAYESLHGTMSYERRFVNGTTPEGAKDLQSLPGPWDNCKAAWFEEVPDIYPEKAGTTYLLSLVRHRTVPLKDVRGLFKLRSSVVVEDSQAHLFNDGSYTSSREYLQYFNNAWHCVGVPVEIDPPVPVPNQESIWMARSAALTAEYDWSVHVGFNRAAIPTISLPSDPVGARDVFKLRDIPPGKSRRDALRHWVSGHYRRRQAEPGYVEKYVWPYLRGSEEFTWNGLYCKIQPSAYDLRKAHEYQLLRGDKNVRLAM